MAGRQVTQTIKFNFEGDISNLRGSIGQIEQKMQNIKLPKVAERGISSDLQKLKTELSKLESKTKGGIIKLDDTGSIQRSGERIKELYTSLTNKIKDLGNVSDKELRNLFPPEIVQKIDDARAAMDKYEKEIKETNAELKKQEKELERLQGARDKKKAEFKSAGGKKKFTDQEYDDLTRQKKYQQGQSTRAKNQMDSMRAQYNKLATKAGINKDGTIDKRGLSDEDKDFAKTYEDLAVRAQKATAEVEKLNKKINESIKISKYNELEKEFNESEQQAREAEQAVTNLKNKINQNFTNFKSSLDLGIDPSKLQDIKAVEAAINGIGTEEIDRLRQGFDGLGREVDELEGKVSDTGEKISGEFSQAANSAMSMRDQFNQLSTNIQYFFGIANGIQLFKRTLREALQTVKELDAAMVKIAVVSDYDMGDMWSTLPEFTKRANELGVAITEVYDATGLYVQQGLDLVESQGLANETLKMAKIAGMDAAAATDAMTSALRGFNMELNQGSAEKVNDIYSKLAAITASDTQEIATAMSKTASIANNAGASIENTSAFLSMIIETTRESAETAGTALKTVIARFSELKKNPAEIGDVDGEIVDANQIESALRLADVDLRDAAGQFRNFDDVIIELSGKWDSLDKNTQRYIATMAAGSRQQSRFLALMSDSERLAQLTDAAYNSAGASTTQFNKTLDSLESKMNQLKNAWNTFTQNLANNELIKFGIDLLTGILTAINGISEAFSGLGSIIGSVLSTTMIAAFFMIAKKGIDALLTGVASGIGQFSTKIQSKMQEITNQSAINGANAGKQYATNFVKSATPIYNNWYTKANQQQQLTGAPKFQQQYGSEFTQYEQLVSGKGKNRITYTKTQNGNYVVSDYKGNPTNNPLITAKQLEKELENSNIEPVQARYDRLGKIISGVGAAMAGLGIASSLLAQQLRADGNEEAAENFEKFGAVLTFVGSAITILIPLLPILNKGLKKLLTPKGIATMAIVAGLTLLVVTISKLANFFSKRTLDGRLKNIKKQTEKAAEAAQKAQEAYSNWLSDKNDYNGLLEAVNELTEGTKAWEEQIDKLQDKIYEMINTYPELAKYIQGDGTFSEEGLAAYEEELKTKKQNAMGIKIASELQENEVQYQLDIKNLKEDRDREIKRINRIKDATQRQEELQEQYAYYNSKQQEINNSYKKTKQGNITFLAQNSNARKDYSEALGTVFAEQDFDISEKKLASAEDDLGVGITGVIGGLGALVGGILAFSNPIGWLIGGIGLAVGGIALATDHFTESAEKAELIEEYAQKMGINAEEIDEDLKNDLVQLKAANENFDKHKKIRKEMERVSAEYFSLGADAQRLSEKDFSIFDDYGIEEGFSTFIDNLKKDGSEELQKMVEYYEHEMVAEVREIELYMRSIFGDEIVLGKTITINGDVEISYDTMNQLKKTSSVLENLIGKEAVLEVEETLRKYANLDKKIEGLAQAYNELGKVTNVTQLAVELKKLAESGDVALTELAAKMGYFGAASLSATNQVKQFYMNLTSDQMKELFKDGKATANSLYELKDSFTDLDGIVDTTNINFATMADVFNDLKEGVIEIDTLTSGFVETLDKLNKVSHSIEDAMAKAANFEAPESSEIIGTQVHEAAEFLAEAFAEERYRDPAIEGYFDSIFGPGAWDKALISAKGVAKNALKQYNGYIQGLLNSDNLFPVWANATGPDNNLWKVSDDGLRIEFNLEGIDSYETLVERIQQITHWSADMIKYNLADAFANSDEFAARLEELQFVDGLNTWVNQLEKVSDTLSYDVRQLKEIYNNGGQNYFTKFEDFQSFVEGSLQTKLGVSEVKTTGKSLTTEGRVSELINNTLNKQKIEKSLDFSGIPININRTGEEWEKVLLENFKSIILSRTEQEKLSNNQIETLLKNYDDFSKTATFYETDFGTHLDTSTASFKYSTPIINESTLEEFNEVLADSFTEFYNVYGDVDTARKQVLDTFSEAQVARWFGYEDDVDALKATDFWDKINDKLNTSEGQATWQTIDYSEEEIQLQKQADLINEGTFKAIQYLLKNSNISENFTPDPNDYNNERIDTLKLAEKQGILALGKKDVTEQNIELTEKQQAIFDLEALKAAQTVPEPQTYEEKKDALYTAYYQSIEDAEEKMKEIDFDWLHNLNELFDETERNLERLGSEYELWLKQLEKTPQEMSKNLEDQYVERESQRVVSAQRAKYAGDRIQGMLKLNDGLMPYVDYNSDTGNVEIDWNALDTAKQKGEFGTLEKANELLDELKTNADIINEDIQLQIDLQLEQIEFLEEIDNTVIDFESQVRDMIIAEYEKEINKMEAIDSSINDANSKLISSIQNSLDRYRQERDNEKTEQNLTDMQNRLALLRADTTGANRQEIMELEKELGEAQEDYTDTLIDQKISALQEQNEVASEQRQEQIDIANAQLESAKENGLINQEVKELLGTNKGFAQGTPLYALWESYNATRGFSKEEWELEKKNFTKDLLGYESATDFKEGFDDLRTNIGTKVQKAIANDLTTASLNIIKAVNGYEIKTKEEAKELLNGEPYTTLLEGLETLMTEYSNIPSKGTFNSILSEGGTSMKRAQESFLQGFGVNNGAITNSMRWNDFYREAINNGYTEQDIIEYSKSALADKENMKGGPMLGEGVYGTEEPMEIHHGKNDIETTHLFRIKGNQWGLYSGRNNKFVTWDTASTDILKEITDKKVKRFGAARDSVEAGLENNYNDWEVLKKMMAYKTGGLNTFTGPAWLDGTPSKPELVLNSTDTQNFLMLKDILSDIMRGGSFTTNQKDGDLNLEIHLNVEQGISSDYDVEQLVTKVKQEIAKVGRERNIQILTKR